MGSSFHHAPDLSRRHACLQLLSVPNFVGGPDDFSTRRVGRDRVTARKHLFRREQAQARFKIGDEPLREAQAVAGLFQQAITGRNQQFFALEQELSGPQAPQALPQQVRGRLPPPQILSHAPQKSRLQIVEALELIMDASLRMRSREPAGRVAE